MGGKQHLHLPFQVALPSISANASVPNHPDQAKRCELIKMLRKAGADLFPPVLSLFTIVSFKNDACASLSGNNGTCFSAKVILLNLGF